MPDGWSAALRLLPEGLRTAARALPEDVQTEAEELRLRRGRPPTVLCGAGERPLRPDGVTVDELCEVLDRATGCSYHAVTEELRRGFLSAPGGVRVGVCGDGLDAQSVSSLCIRVPRQLPEALKGLPESFGNGGVLILSPPGGGKTTLLRELVRRESDRGRRVSLVDERGELAAVCHGEPQFDVGRCTDVLSLVPKAEAVTRLLRAMNPEIIALDELSDPADLEAIRRAAGCGVILYATVHAAGLDALRRMERFQALLNDGTFVHAVCIERGPPRRCRVETI